ncbi:MAG: hypothetical protein V1816_17870 [Pseudomonadota bacterium]
MTAAAPKDLEVPQWRRVKTVMLTPRFHHLTWLERVTWADLAAYPLIPAFLAGRNPGLLPLDHSFHPDHGPV